MEPAQEADQSELVAGMFGLETTDVLFGLGVDSVAVGEAGDGVEADADAGAEAVGVQ